MSVIAGVYFGRTSVIYFCLGFSCYPCYRSVHYSEVSARRELTVLHGENVDKGKFISYGEGGITFWVCGFGGLHALHFTHFNQPLKYATLLHYSHIPNKHKKLHICLVQRQPNIRSLSVLSYRASSLNLVVCRDVTLVVVWVLA